MAFSLIPQTVDERVNDCNEIEIYFKSKNVDEKSDAIIKKVQFLQVSI